jgi:hypothetical protein
LYDSSFVGELSLSFEREVTIDGLSGARNVVVVVVVVCACVLIDDKLTDDCSFEGVLKTRASLQCFSRRVAAHDALVTSSNDNRSATELPRQLRPAWLDDDDDDVAVAATADETTLMQQVMARLDTINDNEEFF